jgi:hypothetical protein
MRSGPRERLLASAALVQAYSGPPEETGLCPVLKQRRDGTAALVRILYLGTERRHTGVLTRWSHICLTGVASGRRPPETSPCGLRLHPPAHQEVLVPPRGYTAIRRRGPQLSRRGHGTIRSRHSCPPCRLAPLPCDSHRLHQGQRMLSETQRSNGLSRHLWRARRPSTRTGRVRRARSANRCPRSRTDQRAVLDLLHSAF